MPIDSLDVVAAARRLVKRLDEIHADSHYQSVWTLYAIHGGDYSNGPKYDKELAELREALEE